jgi:glycosyltransferase involved in cell wall biosynthesis
MTTVHNTVVIMPAYNAGAFIERTFVRIPDAARQRIACCIVCNDGSTDDTAEALGRLAQSWPDLVVLTHEQNRGYGATEKDLLDRAKAEGADVTILLHADGQYSPEKIPELLDPFDRAEADIVQGSRMLGGGALKGGMPLYKFVANKALTAVENAAFGMRLAEYHSGFMLYSRKLLDAVPYRTLSDSFDIDIEMMLCAKILGMPIREVAIPTIYAGEKSHVRPIKYGMDVLRIVKRFRRGHYHALLKGQS